MLPELIAGRYQQLGRIGKGGFGEVYRCSDLLTGGTVALKRMREDRTPARSEHRTASNTYPDWMPTAVSLATGPGSSPSADASEEARPRRVDLAREFRVMSSLRHPNIVSVIDYGFEADGDPFFTMTLLEEAQDIVTAAADQSGETKLELLFQLLHALSYLHRHGVLHRDIKPSNILVSRGRVTVLDFGISGLSANLVAGTPIYMAPELSNGGHPSHESDLYATGVVAFEVLSGRTFTDRTSRNLSDLGVDESLRQLVGHLLEPDPIRRYRDVNRVIEDLAKAAGQLSPQGTAEQRESYLKAAPLTGRRKELSQLTRILRLAMKGKGSSVLLAGESGVGKSRLVEELRSRALVRGVMVLAGGAEINGPPYVTFRDAVLRLALVTPPNDLEAGILKVVFPDIERVLRRTIKVVPVEPESFQETLAETIAGLFRRYGKPILLEVENCHNLREELPLLRKLSQLAPSIPLAIVATYRNDERPGLPVEYPEAMAMRLGRLRGSEIRHMCIAMLGKELGDNARLVEFLARETEGNAFFLVEAVKVLAEERGSLSQVSGDALPEKVFSGGIQETIQRRLRQTPAWVHEHLRLAAVLGREVNPDVLAAGMDGELEPFLEVCGKFALLEGHGYNWRFTHDKLREGILDQIDSSERAALHMRAALAIENRFAGNPDWLQALAFHWREGGVTEKATHYTLMAAGQMLALGVPEKAVALSIDALRQLGELIPEGAEELSGSIAREAMRAAMMLAERPFAELDRLPRLEDARIDQVIRLLKLIQPAAHIAKNPDLFALSVLRCMTLTLEHGAGPWTAEVFATYAALLRSMTNNSRTADKYSQLSIRIDQEARGRVSGPVAFVNAWFVLHWLRPVKESMALAEQGAASSVSDGDLLYAAFCLSSRVMYLAASGAALPEVIAAADECMHGPAGRIRVSTFHCILERQFALALAGRTQDRLSLTDSRYDEESALASIFSTTNYNQIPYFCLAKMRLHYYWGEYEKALEYAARALPLMPAFQGQIAEWEFTFYRALTIAGRAPALRAGDRARMISEGKALAKQIGAWAVDNPDGFAHKHDLVLAELARAEDNWEEAASRFEQAAARALRQGMIHDSALAHERAADCFASRGNQQAEAEARVAVEQYRQWGAEAKAAEVSTRFLSATPGSHG